MFIPFRYSSASYLFSFYVSESGYTCRHLRVSARSVKEKLIYLLRHIFILYTLKIFINLFVHHNVTAYMRGFPIVMNERGVALVTLSRVLISASSLSIVHRFKKQKWYYFSRLCMCMLLCTVHMYI